ncbi:MAG: hypothetical protein RLZZ522_151 [Verrucomicrobiota bacterium]
MTLLACRPDYHSPEWELLTHEMRTDVRAWLNQFSSHPGRDVTRWLQGVAVAMGVSYPSARRKYDALRHSGGDWTCLIDRRKLALSSDLIDGTSSPAFRAYLVALVGTYKRNNAAAFRQLKHRWISRHEVIPGYESWANWPAIPTGWHKRNLARIVADETSAARLRSIRVGTSSKTNIFLPHVYTTRVGLWPGAVIQLDDVWHDNYVTLGAKREVVRVLELGALDLFSAHRFQWGAKPRRRRENGSWETLAGKDMRLFTAGMFHRHGYAPQGTMLMSEHQTAKVSEDIARILYDATHGMIRVDYQPIEGKQAALNGFWSGTEGGNFRAKACLESTHNLIHNDLGHLLGQTGSHSSGIQGPVTTDRIVAYTNRIVADVLKKFPERINLLRLPLLDFHTQFIPFLMDYYEYGLARRTDHELADWEALGHVITEYTTAPGSNSWISESQFLDLDPDSQIIIGNAARRDPAKWSQRRKLSPLEVWNRRPDFNHLSPSTLCDIIGMDMAREATAFRGFVEFSDQEIAADVLVYKARFCNGPRRGNEIPHGEKVLLFANPFDDSTAMVLDAKGVYQGELPKYKSVLPINPESFGSASAFEERPEIRSDELKRAAGEKHARIADILEPDRINAREDVREARDLRAHNRRVLSGAPVTSEEIHEARVAAGQQGSRTAAANRLQSHGTAPDWDSYRPVAAPSAFESLPDDEELPEAF